MSFILGGTEGPGCRAPGETLTEGRKARPAAALPHGPPPACPSSRSAAARPSRQALGGGGSVPACSARRLERRFPSDSLPLQLGCRPPRSCRHHEVRAVAAPCRPIRGHPPWGGRRRPAPSFSTNTLSPLILLSRAGSSCAASVGTRSTRAMGAATLAPTAR